MDSPFDDPELREQLRRAGIVHRPGLARDTLNELAPLLAAEGVDLDRMDETDLDTVNAALASATARHNMELFTPVGARRGGAHAVIKAFAVALTSGNEDEARAVLAQVEPEPDGEDPAVSHVIGVALGALDSWFADPAHRSSLTDLHIPRWDRRARAAATDIDALARKSRAFDSLGSLHRNHNGLAIFEGSALAVAAALAALARQQSADLEDVADRLLHPDTGAGGGLEPVSPTGTGAAFGLPRPGAHPSAGAAAPVRRMTSSASDRPLVRQFARWMKKHSEDSPAEVNAMKTRLAGMFTSARRRGIDLHDPDGVMELAEGLGEEFAEHASEEAGEDIDVLHAYVHYQMATTGSPVWDMAHDAVEGALGDESGMPPPILDALAAEAQLDPDERAAAVAGTRVVAAVGELLDWLGSGRPCAPSGGFRRADIQYVAGLLGFSAVGVNKRPSGDPGLTWLSADQPLELGTIHALSMQEVPPLDAWWGALCATDLLEIGSTRMWPGVAASDWSRSQPDLELAEMLIATFIVEVVTARSDTGFLAQMEELEVVGSIGELMVALAPAMADAGSQSAFGELMRPRALLRMHYLAEAGVLERDAAGVYVVPDPLRPLVARALLLASSVLTEDEEMPDEDG